MKSLLLMLVLAALSPLWGDGIAAPVMPFSPNRASADLPGTIGLGTAVFAPINAGIPRAVGVFELLDAGFVTSARGNEIPMRSIIPGYGTFRAIRFLITGPMILGMLFFINLLTSPGHWWVQYAAIGIGIAWVISMIRVIRSVIVAGGVAGLSYLAYRYFTKQPVSIPTQLV